MCHCPTVPVHLLHRALRLPHLFRLRRQLLLHQLMPAKQLNWLLRQLPSMHRHSQTSRLAILVDTNPRLPRWGQLYSNWTAYSLVDPVVLREQGTLLRLARRLRAPGLREHRLQLPGLDLRLAAVLPLLALVIHLQVPRRVLVPRLPGLLLRLRVVLQAEGQVLAQVPPTVPTLPFLLLVLLTVTAIH